MGIFAQMQALTPGDTVAQYMTMIKIIDQVIDEQSEIFKDMEPPEELITEAKDLKMCLDIRRVVCRHIDAMESPVNANSRVTSGTWMWILSVKLALFRFGIDANEKSDRRKSLQNYSINPAKSRGLVIYDDDVLNYTMFEVHQSLLRVRERWQYIDLSDKQIMDFVSLLEFRAGYLANYSGNATVMDMPQYRVECDGQYYANEDYWVEMDIYFHAIWSHYILYDRYNRLTLNHIHEHAPVIGTRAKNIKAKWRRYTKDPVRIEMGTGMRSWHNFIDKIFTQVKSVSGTSFQQSIRDHISNLFILLPAGEFDANVKQYEPLKLLMNLYPSSGANNRMKYAENINSIQAFLDCRIRSELVSTLERDNFMDQGEGQSMSIDICIKDEKCPEYDIVMLIHFDSLMTKYGLHEWMNKYVLFAHKLSVMSHRPLVEKTPVIINIMNKWNVLFEDVLWETKEVLLACFVWCYFIWYSLQANVPIASREISLKLLLSEIFAINQQPIFAGIEWPIDAICNIKNVHE